MQGMSKLDIFWTLSKWKNEYMPAEYTGDIFHYTSPAGFNSIMFTNPDNIVLWASRYDCLNDMSEGKVVEDVYKSVCDELKEKGKISLEMYTLFSGITPSKTQLMYRVENGKLKKSRVECDRFICSFSKNKDSLPMWNYYVKGSQYEGFNLGFYANSVQTELRQMVQDKEVGIHVYPVVYDLQEQKRLISEVLLKMQEYYSKDQETSIRYTVSNQLTDWKLVFKNECFRHEEEVRIIVDVARKTKNGVLQPQPLEVKYRTSHGLIVPYIELHIEKDSLASVCMGPLQCSDEQRKMQQEVLREWLDKNNYLAETAYSEVPVRF